VKLVRFLIALLGLLLGYQLTNNATPWILDLLEIGITDLWVFGVSAIGGLILAIILYLISPYFFQQIVYVVDAVDLKFQKTPMIDIAVSIGGLVAGLILANLLTIPLLRIPIVGAYLPVIANVILGYFGLMIAWKKRDDLTTSFGHRGGVKSKSSSSSAKVKVLDTSVIIDGRIADICETGIVEGTIGIPVFVLHELQHIADSEDDQRRNRGRRGLDVLNRMQKNLGTQVKIFERDFPEIKEVDSKLVALAQSLDATIITNDYNLNKVCRVHNIPVLNINELANAVKPVVLPGERMQVLIIKSGKERNQGVGYLDDGTMIVVEEGKHHMNEAIEVEVTSVLQTAAGRMIFAKIPS
jgi:uncharacterized protein YacL